MTSILLVDDHTLLREGLVRLLEAEPTLHVVGHCSTVSEARQLLEATPVHLILLDYDLGPETGDALLQSLRETGNPARVIILTAGMLPSATLNAIQNGVAGVILKQSGTRQLLEAIARVTRGETWWSSDILRSATNRDTTRTQSAEPARELTQRQHRVLRGILDGLSNKEIATQLDSSETSIKASIQELFTKAGVRTRGQLVRVTLERFSSTWLRSPNDPIAR